MLIPHIVDPDTSSPISFHIGISIVHSQISLHKVIFLNSGGKHFIDELFIPGDFENKFHPDLVSLTQPIIRQLPQLIRVKTDRHMSKQLILPLVDVFVNPHGHTHIADLSNLLLKPLLTFRCIHFTIDLSLILI